MKFCEAMEKLKGGSKVTRAHWQKDLYFKMVEDQVKCYQPKLDHYVYDDNIMVSTGWIVEGHEQEQMAFCDIVPHLQDFKRAWMSDWTTAYIYLDSSTGGLVCHTMAEFPFTPSFTDFIQEDWIELS